MLPLWPVPPPPVCFYYITTNKSNRVTIPIPPLVLTESVPTSILDRDKYILEEFHVAKYFSGEVRNILRVTED